MSNFKWQYHQNTAQPSSKTELEHKLSRSQIYPIPHPIRDLWNPQTCPLHLLPYLAWARSVDYWSDEWPEQVKRDVVAAAYYNHKHKGTISALERVASIFGLKIKITEWWQANPQGVPGTFGITVLSENAVIGEVEFKELVRLFSETKPVSRHISVLTVGVITRGRLNTSAATLRADTVTIYPYIKPIISMPPAGQVSAAAQRVEIITINPKV